MKLERQKLIYREDQALLPSPALSAALLLGKTRVEARYLEGTAPRLSPPGPQHAELTLAGTLLVTVAKGKKGEESLLLRGSTWKTRSHFVSVRWSVQVSWAA